MGFKTTIAGAVLAASFVAAGGAQTPDAWRTTHVIVVGMDGLSVDAISRARMPRLRELMARSAWTLEARGVMPTLSSPNWESVITGAAPEQHGITSNGWFRKMVEIQPTCRGPEGKFPTIFSALRSQHPDSGIALFLDWGGFAALVEKQAPDVMQHESGAARTVDSAIRYWRQHRPALTFIHLDNLDHAGHGSGWLSSAYYRAAGDGDAYLGRVIDMVDELSAWDSTFILVTSDHGGTNHGHGKNSLAEIQIPWVLSGPGVAPGRITAPVNTFDTAATLAWIFSLDTAPCAIGRPVLSAFNASERLARADAARPDSQRECAPPRPSREGVSQRTAFYLDSAGRPAQIGAEAGH